MKGCVLCGGSGWAPVTGRSRFDGLEVSAVRECLCKRLGAPVKHEDNCNRCHGHGIYGGQIGTKYDGPWKWCDCAAGRERQAREPNLIDEANAARVIITGPRAKGGKGLRAVAELIEPYHGLF